MNHAVAVRTQHRKIRGNIVSDCHPLRQTANRFEMMRFNKAVADSAIALRKTQITGLTARAMKFFSGPRRSTIALNFPVIGVFAGFNDVG